MTYCEDVHAHWCILCSDGCITKAPNDALRSVLASQSAIKLGDWSATAAVDLGSYFTLGVKTEDTPVSSPVPLSARTPSATPRPSSSRARVSNQCMLYLKYVNSLSVCLSVSVSLSQLLCIQPVFQMLTEA